LRTVGPDNIIEVFDRDSWKGLCADSFDYNSAAVICRQLGLGQPIEFHSSWELISVPDFWVNDLQCSGLEYSVFDCAHNDGEGNN
jgi:hypothetical protein